MADTTLRRLSSSLSLAKQANIPGLHRDNDPTTLSFRHGNAIELEDITSHVNTHLRAVSPTASSSTAPPIDSIWSSRKASSMTKPTSHGTNPSAGGYYGKGKGVVNYAASSLGATQGSGSDTDREAQREEDTLGVGSWVGGPSNNPAKLPGKRPRKFKKPDVVVIQHQRKAVEVHPVQEELTEQPASSGLRGSKYLRRRRTKFEEDDANDLALAEEGLAPFNLRPASTRPLSRLRFGIIITFVVAIALTLSLAAWSITHTSQDLKHQIYCVKAILFGSITLVSIFTAIVMVAMRRVLLEVLLMAVVEFLVGSMLLFEIAEFMEHSQG